eukprot:2162533-Prymnesium_polylepis.1
MLDAELLVPGSMIYYDDVPLGLWLNVAAATERTQRTQCERPQRSCRRPAARPQRDQRRVRPPLGHSIKAELRGNGSRARALPVLQPASGRSARVPRPSTLARPGGVLGARVRVKGSRGRLSDTSRVYSDSGAVTAITSAI